MKVLSSTLAVLLCLAAGQDHHLRGNAAASAEAEPVPVTEPVAEEGAPVELASLGVESNSEAAGATCEKWVTCKDGFFGNIKCSGSRYCKVWGPAPGPHGASCKKWVTCKDGFFGNIRCSGSRYCEAWR
ncbi:unnamed protein product [Durusdinium trenchii]|uniref:Uncharacterized protein n=2 Tax=Durusdinium trenchii TaxID=1381693 RepID=A0ABP0HDW8_9DINO